MGGFLRGLCFSLRKLLHTFGTGVSIWIFSRALSSRTLRGFLAKAQGEEQNMNSSDRMGVDIPYT
jgi:hypothetical protein